jgi:hypothetical protein
MVTMLGTERAVHAGRGLASHRLLLHGCMMCAATNNVARSREREQLDGASAGGTEREERCRKWCAERERAVMVVWDRGSHTGALWGRHASTHTPQQLSCVHVASPWTAVAFDPGSE